MVFSKDLGHELVDVERNHVLVVVAVQLANVFGQLFYFASFLNHIDVDDSMVRTEYILVVLLE